jgi:hypothetical protein
VVAGFGVAGGVLGDAGEGVAGFSAGVDFEDFEAGLLESLCCAQPVGHVGAVEDFEQARHVDAEVGGECGKWRGAGGGDGEDEAFLQRREIGEARFGCGRVVNRAVHVTIVTRGSRGGKARGGQGPDLARKPCM